MGFSLETATIRSEAWDSRLRIKVTLLTMLDNIKRLKGGGIDFTQRALIDSIIEDVGLKETITKPVPSKAHVMLLAHKDQPRFALNFDY